MSLIDSRGRLLGRWNLIDAATLGAAAVFIFLGYGAFVLFRMPTPTIASVTPNQIYSQQTGTLHLTGDHLRPFLRVRLGSAITPLLVASPTSAEVSVNDLPPGVYDLALLDEARELVRLPRAITVLPSVPSLLTQMQIQAVGAFVLLTASDAARVSPGLSLDDDLGLAGQVLAVRPPEVSTQRLRVSETSVVTTPAPDKLQVPAIVRFRCVVVIDRCRFGQIDVVNDALLPFAVSVPHAAKFTRPVTHLVFRVDELRTATAPLTFESRTRPVTMEMQAVGQFINLLREDAARIRVGSRFERARAFPTRADMDEDVAVADVLTARRPETGMLQVRVGGAPNAVVTSSVPNTWQVPAIVRLRCVVTGDQCRIGEANLSEGAIIPLAVPTAVSERLTRPSAMVLFRIEQLGPVEVPLDFPSAPSITIANAVVRVKFVVRPEAAGLPMAGDQDFGVPVMPGKARAQNATSAQAAIVSVDTKPQTIVAMTVKENVRFEEAMATFEATLNVPVILTSTGWQYAGRPVKVGVPFRFEGLTYAMDGWVLELQMGAAVRAERAGP